MSSTDPNARLPALESPRAQVALPATALMLMAGFCALLHAMICAVQWIGLQAQNPVANDPGGVPAEVFATGRLVMAANALGIVAAVAVLLTAFKMRRLEWYRTARVAAILVMLPFLSPCCFLGVPIGIWTLLTLARPEVRAAFRN